MKTRHIALTVSLLGLFASIESASARDGRSGAPRADQQRAANIGENTRIQLSRDIDGRGGDTARGGPRGSIFGRVSRGIDRATTRGDVGRDRPSRGRGD